MECGEMGISAAMRAYVDLVAQLSPSWGLDSRLVSGSAGGGKEEEDDITMAYYFLGHEAIDALYNYGRQEAVPMQAPYYQLPYRKGGGSSVLTLSLLPPLSLHGHVINATSYPAPSTAHRSQTL